LITQLNNNNIDAAYTKRKQSTAKKNGISAGIDNDANEDQDDLVLDSEDEAGSPLRIHEE
jgi:hypothetical protein